MSRALLTVTRLVRRLRHPLVTARATYATREGFELRLTTDDGRVGRGEAMPLVEFGTESIPQTLTILERFAEANHRGEGRGGERRPVGEGGERLRVLDVPGARADLGAWLQGMERSPAARHALELAALDLQAQAAGVPLACWLADGSDWSTSIEVNALLGAQSPEALAHEGQAAVADGARTLKVKVGTGSLAQDVARLESLRAAVGNDVRLRLDANGAWSRGQALDALRALSAGGALELCEQPVAPQDVEGLAVLRGRVPCAIGADEALATPGQVEELLERRAADVLVLKPMVLGGLLPAMELARRARCAGMDAIVTSALDGVVARAGAAHLAAVLGSQRAHGLWVGPLFADEPEHPFAPVHGRVVLPTVAGLGCGP